MHNRMWASVLVNPLSVYNIIQIILNHGDKDIIEKTSTVRAARGGMSLN